MERGEGFHLGEGSSETQSEQIATHDYEAPAVQDMSRRTAPAVTAAAVASGAPAAPRHV